MALLSHRLLWSTPNVSLTDGDPADKGSKGNCGVNEGMLCVFLDVFHEFENLLLVQEQAVPVVLLPMACFSQATGR